MEEERSFGCGKAKNVQFGYALGFQFSICIAIFMSKSIWIHFESKTL